MAVYDKETKFYYLQVKEDFFDDDAIEWLEDRPNGEKYSNFYLKLCLKSLKTNGILIKKVGTMLIPYDAEALQKLTGVKDIDTVKVAMDLLVKAGLVRITEEHAIYISQLENLIGQKSLGALKKQQQRERKKKNLLIGGQQEDNCPPKIELELKQKLELELEQKQENLFSYLENNYARTISPTEIELLWSWLDTFTEDIIKYAIDISCFNNKKTMNYVNGILNNWKSKGFKRLEECMEDSKGGKNNESNESTVKRDGSEFAEYD